MGRHPTPTAILELRGSWRAQRRRQEPRPPPDSVPVCPDWLDAEARAVWETMLPQLQAMGVATALDTIALARYCVLFVRWQQLDLLCRQCEGSTIACRRVERACRQASTQLLKVERMFGMTPAGRVRLGLARA